MSAALDVLNGLVTDDGADWGSKATPVQVADATALLDPAGPRRHWISRSRGYAKTDDLSAVTLAAALTQLRPGAQAIVAAADRDQARIAIDRIRGFVQRTPGLRDLVDVQAYRAVTSQGVSIEALAADGPSAWGLLPAWATLDELCQWPETPNALQLFEAVTTALPKVRDSRLAIITTSGSPGHWSRQVFDDAVAAGSSWRVAETHGPPPWMDPAEVEAERRRLPASSFARLFQNEWAQTADRLFSLDEVLACVRLPGPLDPREGVTYMVGVDLALRNDRAVAATCHLEDQTVVCDQLDVFSPSAGRDVDLSAVEDRILARWHSFGRAKVVFDPAMGWQMIQRLRRHGVRVVEHTFSASSNSVRVMRLLELVREGRLALPDDRELVDELTNLRLRETSPGVYRHDHSGSGHDDRATALSLAAVHLLDGASRRRTLSFRGTDKSDFPRPDAPARTVQVMAGDPGVSRSEGEAALKAAGYGPAPEQWS